MNGTIRSKMRMNAYLGIWHTILKQNANNLFQYLNNEVTMDGFPTSTSKTYYKSIYDYFINPADPAIPFSQTYTTAGYLDPKESIDAEDLNSFTSIDATLKSTENDREEALSTNPDDIEMQEQSKVFVYEGLDSGVVENFTDKFSYTNRKIKDCVYSSQGLSLALELCLVITYMRSLKYNLETMDGSAYFFDTEVTRIGTPTTLTHGGPYDTIVEDPPGIFDWPERTNMRTYIGTASGLGYDYNKIWYNINAMNAHFQTVLSEANTPGGIIYDTTFDANYFSYYRNTYGSEPHIFAYKFNTFVEHDLQSPTKKDEYKNPIDIPHMYVNGVEINHIPLTIYTSIINHITNIYDSSSYYRNKTEDIVVAQAMVDLETEAFTRSFCLDPVCEEDNGLLVGDYTDNIKDIVDDVMTYINAIDTESFDYTKILSSTSDMFNEEKKAIGYIKNILDALISHIQTLHGYIDTQCDYIKLEELVPTPITEDVTTLNNTITTNLDNLFTHFTTFTQEDLS